MTHIAELLHEKQTFGSAVTPAELTRHTSMSSAATRRNQDVTAENTPLLFRQSDQHGQFELIRLAYERCHPEDSFQDLKHRAPFSKEAKGLLRDWLTIADRTGNSP